MTESLRIVLVHSGHTWSTHDVYVGIRRGLESHGVEVVPYRLDTRMPAARRWLEVVRDEFNEGTDTISANDVQYQACKGIALKVLEELCDGVVIVSGLLVEPRATILLRRLGIPVFVYGTESPYEDDRLSKICAYANYVSVNEPDSVAPMQSAIAEHGGEALYLPTGFDPSVHRPGIDENIFCRGHDVVFVGSGFPARVELMESVDWSGIDLGLYGSWIWNDDGSPLDQYIIGGVIPNRITTEIYKRSKIVLNLFREDSDLQTDASFASKKKGKTLNPRIIEAAAAGNFVISEYRPSVPETFGDDVPTFETGKQLRALVDEWLQKDSERDIIASRMPEHVEGYSYANIAAEILKTMFAT